MSVAITDVYISGFEQVFPCKATSYVKLVSNFINDESSPYRWFFILWMSGNNHSGSEVSADFHTTHDWMGLWFLLLIYHCSNK